MSAHPADSTAQRTAELEIIAKLNVENGWNLSAEKIQIGEDSFVTVDAIDRTAKVLVEIFVRVGKRSSTRDKKVVADAAKLALVNDQLGGGYRMVLVGCDEQFLSHYRCTRTPNRPQKWHAVAIAHLGVDVINVELAPMTRVAVVDAQERQSRANLRTQ